MPEEVLNGVLDPDIMRAAAIDVAKQLKLLANPERLLLLCQLSQGELSVSELESSLQIRQPTLSQQLGVLRNEGVVNARKDSKYVYYSIADQKLMQVLALLYALYCPKGASND
ncbi:MAG TPA: metalloregulator ArsR/SmtB family transcription factor [Castellaniella sp.]|nr:metalloregulator ArsR/SmtB family transcription factor [Castellaniella sp.]